MPILKPTRGIQINKSHPLARGLVGCWLFNEGSGNALFDIAEKRFNLSKGGSPIWVPGNYGWAIKFDDTSKDYYEINKSFVDGTPTDKFSIACLFNSDDYTENQVLVAVSDSGDEYAFSYLVAAGNQIGDPIFAATCGLYQEAETTTGYTTNKWHIAHGVWNYPDENCAYIDGGSKGVNNSPQSKSGYNRLSIGRVGDASPSTYFSGKISAAWFWDRALTDGEIAQHAREPFCMFERGLSPATLYLLSGGAVELTGSIDISTDTTVTVKVNRKILASCEGATEVTAVLKLSRSLAAALQSLANLIGSLTLVGQVQLAGSISATLSLTAKLSLVTAGKWFTRLLEAERQWLINTLFAGMTANAIKLGTVLSNGWFWMRRLECSVLYRGLSMDTVDFANILTVAENNDNAISPPDYISHNAGSSYLYVVRRFNSCGYQEYTLSAAVKVAIDINGNLIKPQPNKLLTCVVSQISGNKVQLLWFYCPIKQKSQPTRFNIYCDNKTGQIDYQEPLTAISYQGRRFYNFDSDMLETGKYLFAIRPTDAEQVENDSLAQKGIQIDATGPDAIDILNAETE